MILEQINLVTVDRPQVRDKRIPNYFLNPSLCSESFLPSDLVDRQRTPSNQDRLENYAYTSSIFDRVFPDVCIGLNRFHKVTRSNRYWRIICGLWLSYFIDICFERFSAISRTSLDPLQTRTKIVTPNASELCSNGCTDFIDLYQSDLWNHYIYGLIIDHFKFAQVEFIPADSIFATHPPAMPKTKPHLSKERIQRFINRMVGRSKYALVSTYLPRRYEWMINLRLGQIPLHWPPITHGTTTFNLKQRQMFEFERNSTDEFETFIRSNLHLHLPKTIVEEYDELVLAVCNASLPRSPKVIFTANQHASSDSFAVWSALQVERGARLVLGQHGGLYGEGLVPTRHEWHEIAVSDQYVTWGWNDPLHSNVVAGFSFTNAGEKERNQTEQADLLLLVTDSLFPYGRLSWSTLDINSKYTSCVATFLATIDPETKKHLLLRMHHDWNRFSHSDNLSWITKIDVNQIDSGLTSIQKLYEKSQVVVCTTLGSTYRETFAKNIPTLLLIDENVYPIRETSFHIYQRLAECRILHTSPESASLFLSEIFADPKSWWFSERVQSSRREFLNQHARVPIKPITELNSILKLGHSTELV